MATTPNYSFSVYSSTDTDVRFLDFRVATAGSQSTSNFYVIDTVLKQHSDAIDSINATPSAFVVKGTYSSGSLYTASVANYPGYKNEQLIVLSLNQKNTGAVQININGTTNKDVMKYGSDGVLKAVDAGDFVANSPVLCLYDGTRFVVIGITSASSITVTGEAGDILQIADDGTIESSGKKAAQPNGIATLDENGNVVQVANMANSAAAVYSGEPVTVEYADENRIGSVAAYGNNSQTSGTTTAPISMNGVDSVQVSGNNLFLNNAETETKSGITFTVNPDKSVTVNGTNSTSGSAVFYTGYNESLPAGSYTLSGASSLTGSAEIEIKIKRVRGTFEWFSINSSLHTRTLNIATGDIIDSFYVTVRAGQTADNVTVYPMLNVGSTALPYEPYNGSITQLPIPRPLHRVGDVRDVWQSKLKSVWDKKIIFDGSADEEWLQLGTNLPNKYRYALPLPLGVRADTSNNNAGSNNFPLLAQGQTGDGARGFTIAPYSGEISIIVYSDGGTLESFRSYLAANPMSVWYQSTNYDGTNGLDVCLTEYQTGFVELDGTENWALHSTIANAFYCDNIMPGIFTNNAKKDFVICSSAQQNAYIDVTILTNGEFAIGTSGDVIRTVFKDTSCATAEAWKAKLAENHVQIAYQLATPEVYATDPVDFDNTAGPLTVVTGGQVEVKMTDFVTDRTPAFLNKLDKTGDGSDVTVTFTGAATDTDIASGDKLSILFGKILKRFSTITSKFTTVDNSITQIESDISDITDGTTVVAQANKVTNALVIMSNSGTALVNYDGSTTANMTLSPSNVGAEPAFTKNTAFNKNFGSSAGTVCQGNDGRLSNARRSSNISMSLSGTNLSISYS